MIDTVERQVNERLDMLVEQQWNALLELNEAEARRLSPNLIRSYVLAYQNASRELMSWVKVTREEGYRLTR